MTLDIREGDILVVDSREYPILMCGDWTSYSPASSPSMKRMCSVYASTKRKPAVSGSVRGNPVAHLTSIKCMPLDPVNAARDSISIRSLPKAPYELLRTIVDGGNAFYELFVENIRK